MNKLSNKLDTSKEDIIHEVAEEDEIDSILKMRGSEYVKARRSLLQELKRNKPKEVQAALNRLVK